MKYTLTYTGKEIDTAIGNALNLQEALQGKQDKLTAGNGIQIEEDGTITATVVDKKYIDNNFVKNLGAAADYRVYMASPEGTNTYKSASNSAVPDTIPLRNNSGQLVLPNQLIEAPGVNQAISKAYGDTKYLKAGTDINLEKNLEVNGTTKLNGGFEPIKSYTAQGQYKTNSGYQTLSFTLNIFAETPINKLEHSFFGSIEILNAKYICNGLYSLDGEGNLHTIGCLITLENAYGVNIMKCTYFNNDIRIMRIADYHDVENWNSTSELFQEALTKMQPKLYPHTLTLTADKSYTLVYQSTDKTEVISVEKLRTIMNVASATDNVILPVCATDLSGTAVLQVTTSVCKIGTADVTAISDKVSIL